MSIKGFINNFKNLIFTRRCIICGEVCDVRRSLCPECEKAPCRIEGEICNKCGVPKENCICENAPFYMSVCAPFYYEGGPKKAVHLTKFKNDLFITEQLGKEMANCVKTRYAGYDFDCCTFTPSHKKDIKKRGYNQAERLAKIITDELGIPCYDLISKDFVTAPQRSLPGYLRTGNLAGALSFNSKEGHNIENMRILLCDDLKTTGSTLNECTKILLFNKAAEVRCVTACIKPKEKGSEKAHSS